MTQKKTNEEIYEREGSVKFVIGDPMYIDQALSGNKKFEELILSKSYRQVKVRAVFEMEDEVPVVTLFICPKGTPMRITVDGEKISYPSNLTLKHKQLGCDTACYVVNDYHIDTMSDGYYGQYFELSGIRNLVVILDGGYEAMTYNDFKHSVLAALNLTEEHKVSE